MPEKHIPAFKEKVEVSKLDKPQNHIPRLLEFTNDKRFIVREAHPYLFEAGQLTSPEEAGKTLKGLFDELATKYGIRAPVQFVIASNENGEARLYNLTDRIATVEYASLEEGEAKKAAEEMRKIFESLISYYEDKAKTDDNFLCDIPEMEQFVYGKREGDEVNHWYLTDTDPFFSKKKEVLFETADTLETEIPDIEQRFGVDLEDVQERAQALMERMEKDLQSSPE